MAYRIRTSQYNFLQFSESDSVEVCNWAPQMMCLPMVNPNDVWFQFIIIADTEEEADDLCDLDGRSVLIGMSQQCQDVITIFSEKPVRNRISATQVLFYWQYGNPALLTNVDIGECFRFRVEVLESQSFCSNCFVRIASECHTSVLEYSNNENAFGFNYCASTDDGADGADCEPLILSFTAQSNLSIPWTAFLSNKYGNTPTVEVWTYNINGELEKPGILVKMDTFPPTQLIFDFGGPNSGILKITK